MSSLRWTMWIAALGSLALILLSGSFTEESMPLDSHDTPIFTPTTIRQTKIQASIAESPKIPTTSSMTTAPEIEDPSPPTGTHNTTNHHLQDPPLVVSNFSKSGYYTRRAEEFARAFSKKSSQVCSVLRPIKQTRNETHRYKNPLEGIFYNKVPKSASSTLASVNRRIALHWGYRLHANQTEYPPAHFFLTSRHETAKATACSHSQAHIVGAGYHFQSRVPQRSFLWASVRHPAARALSRVFFLTISQRGKPIDDGLIIGNLKTNANPQAGTITKGKGGFTLQYLTMTPTADEWTYWDRANMVAVKRPKELEQLVQDVIQDYDFIAMTERLDESLVVLQMLLDLRLGDILCTSAKVAGQTFFFDGRRCIAIQPTVKTLKVKEFLESDTWEARNYADYLLYAAVNKSLDLTIDKLGRTAFQERLDEYRKARNLVNQICWTESFPPCSSDGAVQLEQSVKSCYALDEGCGYACIDRLVKEHGW